MVMTKMVKKLWQGKYVSVRDYEVKQAIAKGGMRIEHERYHAADVAQLQQLKPLVLRCKVSMVERIGWWILRSNR